MVFGTSSGIFLGVFVALLISVFFGAGDFWSGLLSKKYSALDFFGAIYLFEIPTLFILVLFSGEFGEFKTNLILIPLGAMGCFAFLMMLHGLSKGIVSVVMSITGLFSLIVPAIASLVISGSAKNIVWVGVVFASVAIICVSQAHHNEQEDSLEQHKTKLKLSLILASLAGILIGIYFTGLGTIDSSPLLKLFYLQLTGFFVGISLLMKRKETRELIKVNVIPLILLALMYNLGQGLFPFAVENISLIVANIIVNLYPGITILLAKFISKEKTSRIQNIGFILAVFGVVLVSLGSSSS